ECASRNNCIHNAAVYELSNDQALLSYSHRAGEGHDDETFLVAGHGFEDVGGFAQLAAGEGSLRHGAHEVVDGVHSSQIERFEGNESIFDRIVQMTIFALAAVSGTAMSFALL